MTGRPARPLQLPSPTLWAPHPPPHPRGTLLRPSLPAKEIKSFSSRGLEAGSEDGGGRQWGAGLSCFLREGVTASGGSASCAPTPLPVLHCAVTELIPTWFRPAGQWGGGAGVCWLLRAGGHAGRLSGTRSERERTGGRWAWSPRAVVDKLGRPVTSSREATPAALAGRARWRPPGSGPARQSRLAPVSGVGGVNEPQRPTRASRRKPGARREGRGLIRLGADVLETLSISSPPLGLSPNTPGGRPSPPLPALLWATAAGAAGAGWPRGRRAKREGVAQGPGCRWTPVAMSRRAAPRTPHRSPGPPAAAGEFWPARVCAAPGGGRRGGAAPRVSSSGCGRECPGCDSRILRPASRPLRLLHFPRNRWRALLSGGRAGS